MNTAPRQQWQALFDADGDWSVWEGDRLLAVTAGASQEDEANARLWATSPELFEALWNMVVVAKDMGWDKASTGRQLILRDAQLALAKARAALKS